MERVVVGETELPSGQKIVRLYLLKPQPPQQSAFKLLVADDGHTIYARQYPHLDPQRPDEWDQVGPYTGSNDGWFHAFGFERTELTEFTKDA